MTRQHHPLVQSLIELRGNPRACVYTEPLWGIPYHLFAPFLTLYMYNLGVQDAQIGLLLSVGMAVQIFSAFIGGVLIDKMGRRLTTLIFDLISWSVPTAIWMLSQNFWWFLVAAVFNGMLQVTVMSWSCLMVEDAEPARLVDMYTWSTVSGLLSVFFAPIAGAMVRTMSLVSAMRVIYGFAFVIMTVKFILLYFWSRETTQGLVRMRESRGVPFVRMLGQYRIVLQKILRTQAMRHLLVIIVLINIANMVTSSFFALFATRSASIPEWVISYFPMARAAIMLFFIFGVQYRLARFPLRSPMIAGLACYVAAIAFMLLSPVVGSGMLAGYVLLDAFAYALVWPRRSSLLAMFVDPAERARILAVMYVMMIAISTPFGWIVGKLSAASRTLPFLLNVVLYITCAVVLWKSSAIAGNGTISGEVS